MRNITCFMAMLLIIIFFSSCTTGNHEIPMGVWQSEDPNIILFIDPVYQHHRREARYLGLYVEDSEEKKIFFNFGTPRDPVIFVYDVYLYEKREHGGLSPYEMLFAGLFQVNGNQLHIDTSFFIGREDITEIILQRVTEYELIDPNEWPF